MVLENKLYLRIPAKSLGEVMLNGLEKPCTLTKTPNPEGFIHSSMCVIVIDMKNLSPRKLTQPIERGWYKYDGHIPATEIWPLHWSEYRQRKPKWW